jgi:RNA polymerase sigma factor (sigma-70 family)
VRTRRCNSAREADTDRPERRCPDRWRIPRTRGKRPFSSCRRLRAIAPRRTSPPGAPRLAGRSRRRDDGPGAARGADVCPRVIDTCRTATTPGAGGTRCRSRVRVRPVHSDPIRLFDQHRHRDDHEPVRRRPPVSGIAFRPLAHPKRAGTAAVRRMSVSRVDSNQTTEASDAASTEGFDEVYSRHYRRVVAAMRLNGLSVHDAEDIAQEAFARAFGGWGRIALGTNPAGYVYRSAFRLATRRRKFRSRDARLREPEPSTPPADPVEIATNLEAVRPAVVALPRRQRERVLLCLFAGFTSVEAGRILRIRASTVPVHLATGRQALQTALGDS